MSGRSDGDLSYEEGMTIDDHDLSYRTFLLLQLGRHLFTLSDLEMTVKMLQHTYLLGLR